MPLKKNNFHAKNTPMDFNRTFQFLSTLRSNNTKDWFDIHRKEYLLIRTEAVELCAVLIAGISCFDPSVKGLEPSACIFRMNRDTRFSANKDPYKTNLGLFINAGGKKANTAGYYLHIEPDASFLAAGIYMPLPTELVKIRQEIDYNFHAFNIILNNERFKNTFGSIQGEKLSRPPKGYDKGNEAIEFLKHKNFIVLKNMTNNELCDKFVQSKLLGLFETAQPMVTFLNGALL